MNRSPRTYNSTKVTSLKISFFFSFIRIMRFFNSFRCYTFTSSETRKQVHIYFLFRIFNIIIDILWVYNDTYIYLISRYKIWLKQELLMVHILLNNILLIKYYPLESYDILPLYNTWRIIKKHRKFAVKVNENSIGYFIE